MTNIIFVRARAARRRGGSQRVRVATAVLAASIALLAGVPASAAAAGKPTRTVINTSGETGTYSVEASGCGFAVDYTFQPGSRVAITELSDGRIAYNMTAVKTVSNPATQRSYDIHTALREIDSFDPVADAWRVTVSGRFVWAFFPGDIGPDGQVLTAPLGLLFEGTAQGTVLDGTGQTIDFSYSGTFVDVCAQLA